MFFKKLFKNEDGSVLLITAMVILLVISGVAALAVDAGYLFAHRRRMVTAADAGALAGAQVMSETFNKDVSPMDLENKAKMVALEMAIKNGAEDTTIDDIIIEARDIVLDGGQVDNRKVIEVRAKDNDKELFFAKLLGISKSNVSASAVATWGYARNVNYGDILPLYVTEEGVEEGLINKKHLGSGISGNWGFLNKSDHPGDGYSDSEMEGFLSGEKPIDRSYDVGNIIRSSPGNDFANSAIKGLEKRMEEARKLEVSKRHDKMTAIIIVGDNDKGGSHNVTIKYFIPVLIEDVIIKNNDPYGSELALGPDFNRESGTSLNWEDVVGSKPDRGLIVVDFSDEKIHVGVGLGQGDQNPPEGSGKEVALTYHKLIK